MTVTQPTTTTTTTVVDMVLKSALPEAGLGMNPTQVPFVNIAMQARK